jgi:hypothetical protein
MECTGWVKSEFSIRIAGIGKNSCIFVVVRQSSPAHGSQVGSLSENGMAIILVVIEMHRG